MERSNIAVIAAASFMLASGSIAQQPAPRGAPQARQTQEVKVSDADLEKFADIYVDLLETQAKFEEEIAGVQTEDQAREVQGRMQQESLGKLARHGWSAERYVLVSETIKADANLTEKTIALIEERD
ncbi:MAG TPA: DUF4168 domain-containing protein [Gammaproteobacteria bacterium]|nr:DUF4168 domain-containing protein [Gammaproteobacteria bacterium]